MRKRDKAIVIRFTNEEYEQFQQYVKSTKLFTQNYLRMLLEGVRPQENPSDEFWQLSHELREIHINLPQISSRAEQLKLDHAQVYWEVASAFNDHCTEIQMLMIDPELGKKNEQRPGT